MSSGLLHGNCARAASGDGGQHWRANRKLSAGTIICFLTGEIVTTQEMLRRVRDGSGNVDDPLQIASDLYILLDEDSQLFPHSCEPNAGIRGSNTLFAIRDISEGEVIAMDFSTVVGVSLFDQIWEMDCDCGAPTCRKLLKSVLSLPRRTLKRYAIAGALPDFVLTALVSVNVPALPDGR